MNKKNFSVIILQIIFTIQLFASPLYSIDLLHDIRIIEDRIYFYDYESDLYEDSDNLKESYSFVIKYVDGLKFYILENGEEYLILQNDDYLVIYNSNNSEPLYECVSFNTEKMMDVYDVDVSSFLIESDQYKGSNINNLNLQQPWVEGVTGNGIGETINCYIKASKLYFFNGYISYKKPYLYNANSRVKKIKITFLDIEKNTMIIDLEDTPNPQTIDLFEHVDSNIIIEILDVYKGTKYDDTCVNAIKCQY